MKPRFNKPNQPFEEQFIDAEDTSFFSHRDQQFSHQALVMETMRKCLEAGSHEMRSGWFNRKTDKVGNTVLTYIEDTRAKFIECVKSLEMVMYCDFDSKVREGIKKLKVYLKRKKAELLEQQWIWYSNLSPRDRHTARQQYGEISNIGFNQDLGWSDFYIQEELNVYRRMFKELTSLSRRLGFYEAKTLQE